MQKYTKLFIIVNFIMFFKATQLIPILAFEYIINPKKASQKSKAFFVPIHFPLNCRLGYININQID